MFLYEDLFRVNSKNAVSMAEDTINNGWVLRGYRNVHLDDIPWQLHVPEERSWNFHIHSWDMLNSLLKAHCLTGDVKFLRSALIVVRSWIHYATTERSDKSPMLWYDMAVGLRSYRLAYLIDAGERNNLFDEAMLSLLWEALDSHRAYLAKDSNIMFHNNHGFYQAAGQLAMGRRFSSRFKVMAQTYAQGQERILSMLNQQFAVDGVHREHSPDYHRMVYEALKAMIDSGLVEDKDTISFADQIEEALSWFVLPNNHIANFGDSDHRKMSRTSSEIERRWSSPEMRFAVSEGKIGRPSEGNCRAFKEGGYFVLFKRHEKDADNFAHSSYLAQIAAFHSRTHKHADDLSFIWSERGSDILVDAGRYGYIGKAKQGSELWRDGYWYADPWRVYCESTRAHNTLEFDNRNYQRKGVKPYGSALTRWMEHESGVIAVETEAKHFRSIRRARTLLILPGKWLIVFDWFHDNLHRPHDVKQWFHIAPDLQLLADADAYQVMLPASEQPLRIASLLSGPTPSRPYIGEEEPVKQGWWSPRERDILPNYAFCYELSGVETGCFATIFNFTQSLVPNNDWSKVNISGRRAQFRWSDDDGNHELHLERPEAGEMKLTYQTN